ncbi:enoyl-CoA hydratase/isomerase family protein [Aeromicrobium tamlense]|uniref:Enoyl-CoA hydratase/carnithine racemase n=1 Tax=Aeromicrobium tamlense TaxID=375541 RepID=A0A8I0FXH5_9ACTN|nr:enoyl-CoA hydratase/isomerase family protein [Aeromicrobium tamlense]MBD1270766.1 enoyl-CoA hydratase/isomerase family protein [Aeromicrobium tamlense]MBD1271102.1 enoyl-CoA hydratase/isomerase family protein [Aeromicrobium tamlense]NYI38158.1 enoyl-CoA hydratase/carnithine racemase [Aeromicrobium tamlense]
MSDVTIARQDSIVTLTFDRPEKLNALTFSMYATVQAEIERVAHDSTVAAIFLRGAGRSFSAGWDRNEAVPDLAEALRRTNACRWAIWDSPHPVVAVTQGHCLGGAFELVLPADLVISTDDCLFGIPEVADGVAAGFNMLPWLTNHKKAKACMLTAGMFGGRAALEWDLVTHLTSAEHLEDTVTSVGERLRHVGSSTLAAIKQDTNQVYESLGMREQIDRSVARHDGVRFLDE